jgi:hypothetical protein
MPGYIQKALIRFKYETPDKIQNSPHPHVIPQYKAKTQYAKEEDVSPHSGKKTLNMSKRLQGLSYTMHEQLTPPSSRHSAQLQPNK